MINNATWYMQNASVHWKLTLGILCLYKVPCLGAGNTILSRLFHMVYG